MHHRDISVNNVMWHICDGKLDFKVIDYDMSLVDNGGKDLATSSKHFVGTLPFMSYELMYEAFRSSFDKSLFTLRRQPFRHLLRHDIASLFYVSLWCIIVFLDHELNADQKEHLGERARRLERGNLERIGDYKFKFLVGPYSDWNFVVPPTAGCLLEWLLVVC